MADYINKKEMFEEIKIYREEVRIAKEALIDKPNPSNSLLKKMQLIVDGMAKRYNFNGYSFLDEMKSRAMFTCWRKANYFDPEKSDNPFGFFSQVVYREFVNVIKEEETQRYVKAKCFYNIPESAFETTEVDGEFDLQDGAAVPFFDVESFEEKRGLKNAMSIDKKRLKKSKSSAIEDLMGD